MEEARKMWERGITKAKGACKKNLMEIHFFAS